MLKNYRSYLQYKELRRRIEAKFAKPRNVSIHTVLFLVVNSWLWTVTFPHVYDPNWADSTYVPGLLTTAWSFILLVHALWNYFHSGFWPGKREKTVEAEMGNLLETQPEFDDADFFQMHRLLDEDIRQHAEYHFSLSMFAISNAFLWATWILTGTNWHGYAIWYPAGFAAFIFVLCGGILNFWRSGRREQIRIQANVLAERPARDRHKTNPLRKSNILPRQNMDDWKLSKMTRLSSKNASVDDAYSKGGTGSRCHYRVRHKLSRTIFM